MALKSFLRKFAVAALALGLLVSGIMIFAPYRANHNQTRASRSVAANLLSRADSANSA